MERFPVIDTAAIAATRDAMHAYAQLLGGWLDSSRRRRKHWWNLSLRPSVRGLTTGVIHGDVEFELELDYVASQMRVRTGDAEVTEMLAGQPASSVAAFIDRTLLAAGVSASLAPGDELRRDESFDGFDRAQAARLHRVVTSVSAVLEDFRAGIREETSPIQIWPHHFDLSMIWLPGEKVAGQNPDDEGYADKQMNFGFLFGDEGIGEPYFYITAYPLPDAMPKASLPAGTVWKSDGFNGAVLLYQNLLQQAAPAEYLLNLWQGLLSVGREHRKDGVI